MGSVTFLWLGMALGMTVEWETSHWATQFILWRQVGAQTLTEPCWIPGHASHRTSSLGQCFLGICCNHETIKLKTFLLKVNFSFVQMFE